MCWVHTQEWNFWVKVYACDQLCYILTNNFQSGCTDLSSAEEYETPSGFICSRRLSVAFPRTIHSGRYAVLVHKALICISLMASEVEKVFSVFCSLNVLFFGVSIWVVCPYLLGLFSQVLWICAILFISVYHSHYVTYHTIFWLTHIFKVMQFFILLPHS